MNTKLVIIAAVMVLLCGCGKTNNSSPSQKKTHTTTTAAWSYSDSSQGEPSRPAKPITTSKVTTTTAKQTSATTTTTTTATTTSTTKNTTTTSKPVTTQSATAATSAETYTYTYIIYEQQESYEEPQTEAQTEEETQIAQTEPPQTEATTAEQTQQEEIRLKVNVNGRDFYADFYDTAPARELKAELPRTFTMSELNGNEKYIYTDISYSAAPEKVGKIEKGDIMLYGDNCLVLFYDSFTTPYSYTYIGHISDTDGLEDAVGKGDAVVSFSL